SPATAVTVIISSVGRCAHTAACGTGLAASAGSCGGGTRVRGSKDRAVGTTTAQSANVATTAAATAGSSTPRRERDDRVRRAVAAPVVGAGRGRPAGSSTQPSSTASAVATAAVPRASPRPAVSSAPAACRTTAPSSGATPARGERVTATATASATSHTSSAAGTSSDGSAGAGRGAVSSRGTAATGGPRSARPGLGRHAGSAPLTGSTRSANVSATTAPTATPAVATLQRGTRTAAPTAASPNGSTTQAA